MMNCVLKNLYFWVIVLLCSSTIIIASDDYGCLDPQNNFLEQGFSEDIHEIINDLCLQKDNANTSSLTNITIPTTLRFKSQAVNKGYVPSPGAATVITDKYDYKPGETAIIKATGFPLGETVEFLVLHIDGKPNIRITTKVSIQISKN